MLSMQKHFQNSRLLVQWQCMIYGCKHSRKIVFIDMKIATVLAYVLLESSTGVAPRLKIDGAWRKSCHLWEPTTCRDVSIAGSVSQMSRGSHIIRNLFCCNDMRKREFVNGDSFHTFVFSRAKFLLKTINDGGKSTWANERKWCALRLTQGTQTAAVLQDLSV